jgi:hypothetical protein
MNLSKNTQCRNGNTNRRDFLKTALVASSATLVLPGQSLIDSEAKTHSWNIGTCDWTLKTRLTSDEG